MKTTLFAQRWRDTEATPVVFVDRQQRDRFELCFRIVRAILAVSRMRAQSCVLV